MANLSSEPVKAKRGPSSRIDWPGLKSMFFSGATLEEIATHTGVPLTTLMNHCADEKWVNSVESKIKEIQSKDIVLNSPQKTDSAEAMLEIRATRVIEHGEMMHKLLKAELLRISKENDAGEMPNSPKVHDIADLEKLDNIVRKNLGIDKVNTQVNVNTIVNVGFLRDLRPAIDAEATVLGAES